MYLNNLLCRQGLSIRETLQRGRIALENNITRLSGTETRFDSIEGLMNTIKRAKIKNSAIIGIVIGLCICFLIWYALR